MKKLVLRILIAAVVLILLVVMAIHFFLDAGIKKGIETFGPRLAKVEIKLDSVSLSLLSGSGSVKGLFVGNPEGFKTPSAIKVGTASLALQPGSLFSDKVVIKSINVQAPEITYETDFKSSNLKRIISNLEAATGGGANAPAQTNQAKAGKKLEVDEFVISGAKLHLGIDSPLGGTSTTVPLVDIHLSELGTGPEGITAADLTKKVLGAVEKEAASVAVHAASDIGKGAADLTKGAGSSASNAVNSVTKGIGDLFKKK